MTFLALALLLQAVEPSSLDLLCTTMPRGQPVHYLFFINAGAGSYTGKLNDKYDLKGSAVVTPDKITLTDNGDKITFRYIISRTTGDIWMESGFNDGPVVETHNGSCSKYTGKAF